MLSTTDALCLDGSAPAFYVAHGDPSRILLHFESGGWCGGITTVEERLRRQQSPRTMAVGAGRA